MLFIINPISGKGRKSRIMNHLIQKGFKVVFSEELPDKDSIVPCEDRNKKSQVGTISYIPAVFGCVCAQAVVQGLMEMKKETQDK